MDRHTTLLAPDVGGIAKASALLRAGEVVAFPTETVYGLGGDARNDMAVARIFAAKGRPRFNPLIVHLAGVDQAEGLAVLSPMARDLAAQFWPGPLTLVLPLRAVSGLSPLVTAELPSVALRIPAHPVARALIAAFGGALAAPSANPSGRISPTTAGHVMAGLGGRIAGVLDGGACGVGVESTILSLLDDTPRLLRQGGLPQEDITRALGRAPEPPPPATAASALLSPGLMASHYAPHALVRLNALVCAAGEVMIGFGAVAGDLSLSPSGDLTEAAARLFDTLHRADDLARARGDGAIAVAPIPDTGLGRAINDRLSRAAAPRR